MPLLPSHIILGRALQVHPNRKFVMFAETEHEIHIRYCTRGSTIDDEACSDAFVALQDGFFVRCPVYHGPIAVDHRWLGLGPTSALENLIENQRQTVGDAEITGIGIASAYWAAMNRSRTEEPVTA